MSISKSIAAAAIGKIASKATGKPLGDKSLVGFGLGLTALRLATKSVPGAMLIGSGLVLAAYVKKKQDEKKTRDQEAHDATEHQIEHNLVSPD